ncbi:MAG TPA: tyrosine-type recombinase/integrase [Kribbellaceae bacterium]|nr:tyrosine-type recombinase/integrase [Kribbellaceae bacterium]
MAPSGNPHPDFGLLADSWDITLDSEMYALNTRRSYARALTNLARWLAERDPDIGPAEVTRDHVRRWIIHTRESTSSGTARSMFAGVRHFFAWAAREGEIPTDPTAGVRTPPPNDPTTPLVTIEEIRALLGTCKGRTFGDRRDHAIILTFVDAGPRLAELAGLLVSSVDLRARSVELVGKGSNRSGPRKRTVGRLGANWAQSMDRYLRARRSHPWADRPDLWLGDRNRAAITADGIDAMLRRRAARVGIEGIHPHRFRHSWADAFLGAGGAEGDALHLGGWRNRAMLDRYGRSNAESRARDAYARLSFGDRI